MNRNPILSQATNVSLSLAMLHENDEDKLCAFPLQQATSAMEEDLPVRGKLLLKQLLLGVMLHNGAEVTVRLLQRQANALIQQVEWLQKVPSGANIHCMVLHEHGCTDMW